MQLFTRDMDLMGPPRAIRTWAADIAQHFTTLTGREVETWQSLLGGGPGHLTWSVRVEGAADLLEISQQAMADEGYLQTIEDGRALMTGMARDTLHRPLTPLPDATTRPGNTLLVTVATARSGKLGDAIGWAIEAAQHVEGVIGRPTVVAAPTVGRFSDLVWLTAARDAAEADENMARTNSDDGYRKLLAKGGELFVDGASRQELFVRIA